MHSEGDKVTEKTGLWMDEWIRGGAGERNTLTVCMCVLLSSVSMN